MKDTTAGSGGQPLTTEERHILEALGTGCPILAYDLATLTGRHSRRVRTALTRLECAGFVRASLSSQGRLLWGRAR